VFNLCDYVIVFYCNRSVVVLCRIRSETNGGAWCPEKQVSKDNLEYLEIDLGDLKVVTLIETQGRFGQGQVSRIHLLLMFSITSKNCL